MSTAAFLDVKLCSKIKRYQISEEPAASIFRIQYSHPENEGNRFLQIAGKALLDHAAAHS
jgi:hypothetical protein